MRNLRVIVVDDDADTLEFMTMLLDMHGYHVLPYATIDGLHEHILREQPDLVVLDLHIHEPLAGWYQFQALRASATTVQIPVLLYSSQRTFLRSHRREVQTMGGDVQEKPFEPAALLAKIEALTSTIAR